MKVIFLDCDGVLNDRQYRLRKLRNREYSVNIDGTKVAILKTIVDETGAKLILSSSWRRYWEPNGTSVDNAGKKIDAELQAYSLQIYDKTPVIEENSRGREIERWLAGKSYVDGFCILDDKDFFANSPKLRQNWIQTDGEMGLTLNDAHTAIGILNGSLMIDMTLHEEKHRGIKTLIQKLFSKFKAR